MALGIGLYVISAVAIISGACIFAFSRRLHNFQKYVGFTFIFEGLYYLLETVVLSPGARFYEPTYLLFLAMMLATPFFFYLAVKYLLKEDGARGCDCWMLVVLAVYILVCGVVISQVPTAERDSFFVKMQGLGAGTQGIGAKVLLATDTLAYALCIFEYLFILVFCAVNIFRFRKTLSDYYADVNVVRSAEVIVAAVALRFALLLVSLFSSGDNRLAGIALDAFMVIFYVLAALYVCRVQHTAEELALMVRSREPKATPAPKSRAAEELVGTRLDKLIESRFYLNPEVTLMDVSSEIQVNSKYVSEYIRAHNDETFMRFVNRLRIEYSETLLAGSDASVADVAEQCGYTSVSTFFRNFTKVRGITPSEFREKSKA